MTSTETRWARPHVAPRTHRFAAATLTVALLLAGAACSQRYIFAPSDPEIVVSGEPASESHGYWILYQNWRISHRDLLLQLDDTSLSLFTFRGQVDEVAATFRQLEEQIPESDSELFDKLLTDYEDLRHILQVGGNRDIIRQRLTGMGRTIRDRFHPDLVAARSPEGAGEGTDPPMAADEGSSGTTTSTDTRTDEGILID